MQNVHSTKYDRITESSEYDHGVKYPISEEFDSDHHLLSIIEYEPGDESPASYHHEPIEEINVVIDGKLDIEFEDEVRTVETGYVTFIPPNVVHAPKNPYDERATLQLIHAPKMPLLENTTLLE